MLGTVVGDGDIAVKRTDRDVYPHGADILIGETVNT